LRSLTQAKLAKLVGLSQGAIGNIESGQRDGQNSLANIAIALGVRYRWLRDGEEPMQASEPTPQGQAMTDAEAALLREFRRLRSDVDKGRAIERVAGLADAQDQAPQLGGDITPMGSRQPRRAAGA
jgi:transcriptional regulator with XRE-family HTH domain